jgi:tRNA threonylcarbamoyladenosine biosynthesis protein TsaE
MRLESAEATEALAAEIAAAVNTLKPKRLSVWLHGELGAGKTTLCRGLLHAMGHEGRVPSPTYTLIEPYQCGGYQVYHLDLYRLHDGAELEYLGVDELWNDGALMLVEWPNNASESLPPADLMIHLMLEEDGNGREAVFSGQTTVGNELAAILRNAYK